MIRPMLTWDLFNDELWTVISLPNHAMSTFVENTTTNMHKIMCLQYKNMLKILLKYTSAQWA